jgi:hypothetical protein
MRPPSKGNLTFAHEFDRVLLGPFEPPGVPFKRALISIL